MRRWVAVLALLLSACSQAASPIASSNPIASATPVTSAAPVAINTPVPDDLPLAKVDFSCRLPVLRTPGTSYLGGFVSFPTATFAFDPRGGIHSDQSGDFTTDATPVLHGAGVTIAGVTFYDLAQQRWIPAGPPQSTPDGAWYAYATWDTVNPSTSRVHVVDVARATEKTFDVVLPAYAMGFTVGEFDAAGIYLVANQFEQLPFGVWLMDPATGATSRVAQVGTTYAIHDAYAWLAGIDPRDPSPPQLRKSGTSSDSIVRVNLATGDKTTWFYRPGMEVWLIGFDSAGRPIVNVSDPSGATDRSETWLTGGPSGSDVLIHAGSFYLAQPQADGDRIWFGNYSGIYLFTAAHGLQKVAAFTDLKTAEAVLPAGFCK
jgi:hypothetical protein